MEGWHGESIQPVTPSPEGTDRIYIFIPLSCCNVIFKRRGYEKEIKKDLLVC